MSRDEWISSYSKIKPNVTSYVQHVLFYYQASVSFSLLLLDEEEDTEVLLTNFSVDF